MKTYRYTPRTFERAMAAGVFADRKVELLGGRLHEMTTNPPHVWAVPNLVDVMRTLYPRDAFKVQQEQFVALGTWRPQPDISVLDVPHTHYLDHLAGPAEIVLLAEVSDTTYRLDSGAKLRRYARAGIATCWILNLPDRFLQVCADPREGRYTRVTIFREGDVVEGIAVAGLLPP